LAERESHIQCQRRWGRNWKGGEEVYIASNITSGLEKGEVDEPIFQREGGGRKEKSEE